MARKDVSPKGLGSAIRMVQYFINRAGRKLSASRRRELEGAKRLLQQRAAGTKRPGTSHRRRSASRT
jgi:tRNA(adenine34) deaminase